jgi:chromate transporter
VNDAAPLTRDATPVQRVSLGALFGAFFVMGATSFGGGVVAYLRETLVSTRGWLSDDDFLTDLELSQTLPGLNATNMSVLVGDRLHGTLGAIVAFLGMTLPGTVVVFVLGVLYGVHNHPPAVTAMLAGVAAGAVGLLLAVTLQIGRKQMSALVDLILLALTFVAVGFLHFSILTVLVVIGPLAVWLHRPRPAASSASS